jgi:hypothetical protein
MKALDCLVKPDNDRSILRNCYLGAADGGQSLLLPQAVDYIFFEHLADAFLTIFEAGFGRPQVESRNVSAKGTVVQYRPANAVYGGLYVICKHHIPSIPLYSNKSL